MQLTDWNDREIVAARSRGGVLATAHPLDNLIVPRDTPWPTPEVKQKLTRSGRGTAFAADQQTLFRSDGLGHYCDLQSLHSEDAITWSVFGTVARAPQPVLERWLGDLLGLLGLPGAEADQADIYLWRRIPHPETGGQNGPEIDFGILTTNAVLLGEAKWRSGVAANQGTSGGKDQLQLRGEWLQSLGRRFYPRATVLAVIGVGLASAAFPNTVPAGIGLYLTTWSAVCAIPSHPYAGELRRYLGWKERHSSGAASV